MRGVRLLLGVLVAGLMLPGMAPAAEAEDVAAARRLFEANLDAIRRRDADAYRACYLDSPRLVRSGPGGPVLGFDGFRPPQAQDWPMALHAYDLRLVPIRDGVVYGSYRYRVVYRGSAASGLSERLFVSTPEGWKIAVTTAFEAPPGTPPPPLALRNGTLVDGRGGPAVPGATVLLRDGKVECAGRSADCPVPEGVDVVDLAGQWVIPGLIDAHVHFSQTGWVDGRPDAVDLRDLHPYEEAMAWLRANTRTLYRSYLYNGVTAVFDVGGYPWTLGLGAAAEADPEAPHVAAAGPLLTTWIPDQVRLPEQSQFNLMTDDESIDAAVRSHRAFGAAAIKVWFIVRPDADAAILARRLERAGEAARRAGLPLIVHATGLDQAKQAIRAGALLLVHAVDDRPVDDEFLNLARAAGVLCTPTLTVYEGYRQVFERRWEPTGVPLEGVDEKTLERAGGTEAIPADRVPAGDARQRADRMNARRAVARENVARMARAGIRLAVGTDAGNPLTLHGASIFNEIEAMAAAGMSPGQVLIAATANGAVALGRPDLGTVEAGKVADLVVLEGDPLADSANLRRIRAVLRAGTWHDRSELAPRPAER